MTRTATGAWITLLFSMLLACGICPAIAHEIGESRVVIETGADRWTARITTAPTPLLNRLELAAGQTPSRDMNRDQVTTLLTRYLPNIQQHLSVSFDGAPAPTRIMVEAVEMPEDPLQPAYVLLRVDGALPAGAQTMSWQFDLLKSRYALQLAGQVHWLDPDAPGTALPLHPGPPPTRLDIAGQYLWLGFIHIVPDGPDHILFVLGLVLLTTRLGPLLTQVTAFTLAHCLTLFLALEGVVSLPSTVVEPLIALSIAYVAVENLLTRRLTPWRPALVFAFGLLHGLGFAGVLEELGLPEDHRILALLSFNLGIEAGQLVVIAAAYGLLLHRFQDRVWYRTRLTAPASLGIALTGLYWTLERIRVL